MNKRSATAVTAAFLLILPLLAAGATVYRWTDAQGNTHFSDRPDGMPGGGERIYVPGTDPRLPPSPENERTAAEEAEQNPLQPDAQAQREVKEKNCRIARDTLAHNESISRMYRMVDGERVFLTDEEREEVMKRSRDDVSKWCD